MLLLFFKACRHKDEKTLIPCHVGESLNTTECLENKCCPSKASHELKCYMPFKDSKYACVDYCLMLHAKCCFWSDNVIFISVSSFLVFSWDIGEKKIFRKVVQL